MAAGVGHHAHAEGKLDASYTISFARIPVGEITATVSSATANMRFCAWPRRWRHEINTVDGEGSFTTRGTVNDGHPVPTNFTSKIISNIEVSGVTMVLDEGSVRNLRPHRRRARIACL